MKHKMGEEQVSLQFEGLARKCMDNKIKDLGENGVN